jgi:hypothetical protein
MGPLGSLWTRGTEGQEHVMSFHFVQFVSVMSHVSLLVSVSHWGEMFLSLHACLSWFHYQFHNVPFGKVLFCSHNSAHGNNTNQTAHQSPSMTQASALPYQTHVTSMRGNVLSCCVVYNTIDLWMFTQYWPIGMETLIKKVSKAIKTNPIEQKKIIRERRILF